MKQLLVAFEKEVENEPDRALRNQYLEFTSLLQKVRNDALGGAQYTKFLPFFNNDAKRNVREHVGTIESSMERYKVGWTQFEPIRTSILHTRWNPKRSETQSAFCKLYYWSDHIPCPTPLYSREQVEQCARLLIHPSLIWTGSRATSIATAVDCDPIADAHSIRELMLKITKACIFFLVGILNIHAVQISGLLSCTDAFGHKRALLDLTDILDDKNAKMLIATRSDTVARTILDLFEVRAAQLLPLYPPLSSLKQSILAALDDSNPLRKRLLRLSSRLAYVSRQMPSNSILRGVVVNTPPTSGGGYADIFKVRYNGSHVAVKRFRFHTENPSNWPALHGVSM
jgi:hypothetical protein